MNISRIRRVSSTIFGPVRRASQLGALALVAAAPVFVAGCGPAVLSLRAQASVSARIDVPAPPPPPPKPAVALDSTEVVEFFGVPLDDASDVLFVLDVSGSMDGRASGAIATLPGHPKDAPADPNVDPNAVVDPNAPAPPPPGPPSKIEVARAELLVALERLPPETRTNVIFFADGLLAFSDRSVALDGEQRARLMDFVASADANGSTALAPALRAAFLLGTPRVVLLSDGQGNVGGDDYDVLRDAREAMRGGVRIDTIGIGDHDRELMQALAAESGGLYQPL